MTERSGSLATVFPFGMASPPSARRAQPGLAALVALGLALPAAAPATAPRVQGSQRADALAAALGRPMRLAGRHSGAYVANATRDRVMFRWRPGADRVLASNTKLFTTSTALARFGTEGRLSTEVRGDGLLDARGVWRGSLYLRGGGDPTFGSRRFVRRAFGGQATVERLAAQLEELGIRRVTGRVFGDESRFDSRRGGPYSGYRSSIWVGPLSALSYNRGRAGGRASFQANPPLFAASRLDASLERRGVRVRGAPRVGVTPTATTPLAAVESPPMRRLVSLANKPSDNFMAEMLAKALAMQAHGRGTTLGGARLAARFARRLGSSAQLVDGSGLSRANRSSPRAVARLLLALRRRDEFPALLRSLPVAGREGTLATRMRRGPARGRCRAKTGTLPNVSALSGYCRVRSGDLYVFSILMNGVYPYSARALQDRMVQAIAGVSR